MHVYRQYFSYTCRKYSAIAKVVLMLLIVLRMQEVGKFIILKNFPARAGNQRSVTFLHITQNLPAQ